MQQLTAREIEMMELMLDGNATNKLLAYRLNIAETTVKVHIRKVTKKFGKSNRLDMVLAYLKYREGKKMERTFETASAPVMFICDKYNLPHAPVYWLADEFLCSALRTNEIADREPSPTYTIPAVINEISAALKGSDTRVDEVIRLIEAAVLRRFPD